MSHSGRREGRGTKIGDLVVEPVFDGLMKAPATAFKGTTEEQWAPHRRFLTEDGTLELPGARRR
jgi:hypothetical protein